MCIFNLLMLLQHLLFSYYVLKIQIKQHPASFHPSKFRVFLGSMYWIGNNCLECLTAKLLTASFSGGVNFVLSL